MTATTKPQPNASQGEKLMLISGGSRGIGAASCQRFLDEGYRVVNLSRSAATVSGVDNIAVDMTDPEWAVAAQPALAPYLAAASSICLIHNAGVLYKDSVHDVEAAAMHRALQVNVVAASQLNQLVLGHMSAGSSILYVASTLGEKAVGNACSYVVSKHAMIGLMRATVQDLFGKGIHSCCVCPGFTDTEMLRDHLGNDAAVLESITGEIAFGRLIEPTEIAEALWFAGSAPVLNGAVLHANLGQLEH